ncbi:MAG: DUF3568 family protein [Opitutales bacterium]
MNAILNTLLVIFIFIAAGCATPVAIDPSSGQQQNAKYQGGYFYGPLDAEIGEVFRVAIVELDAMGYFRTGELHKEDSITIYGRKQGDEKFTLRTYYSTSRKDEGATSMIRIRIGQFGNLAESQLIYARIRDAL